MVGVDVVPAAILRNGSEAEAPETSTGILPVQCHGQALAEHDRTGVRGLELAGSQSRRFGKLRPDTPGDFPPSSTHCFHDHGGEGHTLGLTQ